MIHTFKNHIISLLCVLLLFFSCTPNKAPQIKWISSTADSLFVENQSLPLGYAKGVADVNIHMQDPLETFLGFGATFTEAGWNSLSFIKESDRKLLVNALFSKDGLNLNYCQTSIGANSFSSEWYSYAEKDNDFNLENFSIEKDKKHLIPFIKAAQKRQPKLQLLATPWSPPAWMKQSKQYACKRNVGTKSREKASSNRLIDDETYYKAYALYFKRYIEAYKNEGIYIHAVAIQNEFNHSYSAPSCEWSKETICSFVDNHLGLGIDSLGVQLVLGNLSPEETDKKDILYLLDQPVGRYFSAIGLDNGNPHVLMSKNPKLEYIQIKTDLGSGSNTWEECLNTWDNMKTSLTAGASIYIYHNMVLEDSAKLHWNGYSNSLISVNKEAKSYQLNPEYYLLKHCSHYVQPGAKRMETSGKFTDILAFINPNRSVVVVMVNKKTEPQWLNIGVRTQMYSVKIKPQSINTFILPETIN